MPQIEDMDFKELREEVQRLRDELARMKRTYEDVLCNLDDDNFSGVYRKKTKNLESSIEQTAGQIKTTVSKQFAFGDAVDDIFSPEASANADTSKLYYWDSLKDDERGYYYYDDVVEKWIKTADDSIYSVFRQTGSGFVFDAAHVRISGDLITEGTITGTDIRRANESDTTITTLNPNGVTVTSKEGGFGSGRADLQYDSLTMYETSGIRRSALTKGALQFYDAADQVEGWSVVLDGEDGGGLYYYLAGDPKFRIGDNDSNDFVFQYLNRSNQGFMKKLVFDLSESDSPHVQFKGLNTQNTDESQPSIEANGQLLATQNWVREQLTSGTMLG